VNPPSLTDIPEFHLPRQQIRAGECKKREFGTGDASGDAPGDPGVMPHSQTRPMSKPNQIMGLVFPASFDASAQTTAGILANAWAVPGQNHSARQPRPSRIRRGSLAPSAPSTLGVMDGEGARLAAE